MTTIRPTDLPEIRDELLHFYTTSIANYDADPEEFANAYGTAIGHEGVAIDIEVMRGIVRSLRLAEQYFVNADMAEVARTASRSLPSYGLQVADLPAEDGLIIYDAPLADIPNDKGPARRIAGAVWGRRGQDIGVYWLGDVAHNWPTQREETGFSFRYMLDFTESVWALNAEDRPHSEYDECGKVLKATWALMQQTLVSVASAGYDRSTRRRLERQNIEPAPVRVITLRRPTSSGGTGESSREYHHQWIVRGHWRQQYYPSREVHRPVWIAPHIKGPEGAPLLGGEKVYAWTR